MAVHRYGVLDANGVKLSTITADSDVVNAGWYPGYGGALIDEGLNPADPPKEQPAPKPSAFVILPVIPVTMSNGDKIDFKTLEVTKAVPANAVAEPIV